MSTELKANNAIAIVDAAIPEEAKYKEWKPLMDTIELPDPPPFPDKALPEVMRDMAIGISKSRKVPVALAATALLAAGGMAIGRNTYFRRKRGFIGRANLYAMVFAARGERKSVTFKPVLEPFYKWMKDHEQEYNKALQKYKLKQEMLANLNTAMVKPGIKEDKRQEFEAQAENLMNELGEPPRNPRFIADDFTPESLFKLMKDAGGTAGIFSDDARIIAKMMMGSVYSSSGESREDFLLRPFDGEAPISRHRVGTGNDFIERPCIGMLLMLQTDFLRKIGGAGAFFASGLISRCLFSYPESWVGKRDADGNLLRADDDYEIPQEVIDRYERTIIGMLDKAYSATEPEYYTLSQEALTIWKKHYEYIEGESGEGGKFYDLLDFSIRYSSQTLRLALQMAIFARHANIEKDDMLRAVTLMEYFMDSAERCYRIMKALVLSGDAKKIVTKFMSLRPGETISLRTLENSCHLTREDVEIALRTLVARSYCRFLPESASNGKTGRKPSRILEINPDLFL